MATSSASSDDTIRRILYVHPRVHIYQIPPLTSNKGHTAATWTNNPPLFTAALHVVEETTTAPPTSKTTTGPPNHQQQQQQRLTTTIHLLDPDTHALFAAAPYTAPGCVEHALDSARFFAVRVVGDGGRRAVLGLGFEERADAFDFGVVLADCRKVLGFGGAVGAGGAAGAKKKALAPGRDLSLKEGEMITVDVKGWAGRRDRRVDGMGPRLGLDTAVGGSVAPEVLPLPPPPSAVEVKRLSRELGSAGLGDARAGEDEFAGKTAEELGFDDGEFGEFQ